MPLAAATALMAMGWLGIGRAEQFADTSRPFAGHQLVWCALGLVVLTVATMPNYRILERFSYLAFAGAITLLLAVFGFPPINGSHRWIRLGPFGLQPSEFAKVGYVLALSRYLMFRENYRRFRGLLAPLAMTLAPMLLILKEPDLGTALIFLPVLLAMLFAAGVRLSDLAKLLMAGLLVLPLLWSQISREQRSRVTSLLEQSPAGQKPTADGYQLYQSKQMLALGGWRGSFLAGDAVDDAGAYHLPEAHTDFIFSVLVERYGLWGTALLLLFYTLLVASGLRIAAATREPFGRLLCVGLAALVGTQALINTGMAIGLLPVTGLSLPLVSYGGSGMLANCLAIGLILNVGMRPGYEVAAEPFRWRE
jgi:cell division protein FtsW (lipid II flippase)